MLARLRAAMQRRAPQFLHELGHARAHGRALPESAGAPEGDLMHSTVRVLSLSFVLAPALAAQQLVAVSPSDRTSLEGCSFTHFPLGRANARMQTLHADVPGGTVLHGHAYRRDAVTVRGQVDAFSCDLEVTVS